MLGKEVVVHLSAILEVKLDIHYSLCWFMVLLTKEVILKIIRFSTDTCTNKMQQIAARKHSEYH